MHGIRTEKNKSPLQLFNAGALMLRFSGLVALDFFDSVGDEYGVEQDPQVCIRTMIFKLFFNSF